MRTFFKLFPLTLIFYIGSGCAGILPFSEPVAKYDEYKKIWIITSTRWGVDRTNTGPNLSFIRVYVDKDGRVESQVYVKVDSKDIFSPKYALDKSWNQYSVQQVSAKVKCLSATNCYWDQDIIIKINYQQIAKYVDKYGDFKIRLYGRLPPQDVLILGCQFWEVTKEILRVKNINTNNQNIHLGKSCVQ